MALPPMRHDGGRELRSARSAAWQLYISVGIFSFAVNLLMLTGPLFMMQVYDRVLSSGSLAIVAHGGGYEIIPREAAVKIQERDPQRILLLNPERGLAVAMHLAILDHQLGAGDAVIRSGQSLFENAAGRAISQTGRN